MSLLYYFIRRLSIEVQKKYIYLFALTISILFAKSRMNCKNHIFTSIFYTAKSSSATFKFILIELLEECYLQQCCLKSCDNKKGKCIKKTNPKNKNGPFKKKISACTK